MYLLVNSSLFLNAKNSLYSNRAACHLKINNLFKCIEDCSKVNNSFITAT